MDTLYENALSSGLGIPGPDGADMDVDPGAALGFNTGVSSIPDCLRDELPAECRAALEVAIQKESQWKGAWKTEMENGARRSPIIDKGMIM